MPPLRNDKLAVLIDADNAQVGVIHELLAEVSRYGTATVKRAYGDWTTSNLRGWKEVLHKLAIQPIQQFSYTTGKNSTDSSLIIDAMDLLHSGSLNGFCLVSSDSDFTRLATRIRETGVLVYGFGERKTPPAFVAACDKFIYTEILKPEQNLSDQNEAVPSPPIEALEPLVSAAIAATAAIGLKSCGCRQTRTERGATCRFTILRGRLCFCSRLPGSDGSSRLASDGSIEANASRSRSFKETSATVAGLATRSSTIAVGAGTIVGSVVSKTMRSGHLRSE
jgi:hypothetical protein